MSAVATCVLDVHTAELLRTEYKPLPADAKRIVDKRIAAGGGDALEQAFPSTGACIRSTLAVQTDLARAVLGDVERLAARSRSARAVCERLREDAHDQTICNAITSGEVHVELSAIETLYGIFPYGQAMAVLAASAFAPAGDHDLSRRILDTV